MPDAPAGNELTPFDHLKRRMVSAGVTALCLLFILGPGIATGGQLAVIELKHRPADEIIPVLTPLLGPSDTLSGSGYQLFLNTTSQNLGRIQSIIAHLDRAAQQLAITVVQGENALEKLNALAISGQVTIGDGVTVGTGDNRGRSEDSIDIEAQSSRRTGRSSDTQRVLVQDGNTATIYVGLSAPVAVGSPRHQGVRYHQIVEYREMLTGVLVTPHLSGDRVTLAIETRRERPSGNQPVAVETQQVQTRLQAKLNQWVEIGTILSGTSRTASGLSSGGSGRQSSQRHVFVRVEAVP